MYVSEELQTLLDLMSKITGNSYYLCDLNYMKYVSTPEHKSLKESLLSRELLTLLLNKNAKMLNTNESCVLLNGEEQIRLFEDQLENI